MTRRFLSPVLFAVMLASVSACGDRNSADATSTSSKQADEKVFRRGNGAEPGTLDPHKAQGVPASNILRDLYEGLVSETADGSLTAGAAIEWTMSDDGRVYQFKLHPEGRWSNGDPVTASDFVYSLQRSVDPATGSEYSNILAPIKNAEAIIDGSQAPDTLGARAIDDLTLEITLHAATPYFLGLLTHSTTYPVHRPSIDAHGDKFTLPGKSVSNGAFVLDEWVVRSHIRLRRNSHYRDAEHVALDAVDYYPIEDANSALKRYRAGELDWTDAIPTAQVDWVRENLPDDFVTSPLLATYYYGFNLKYPALGNNAKLRRALSMAIDRSVITDKIGKLGQIPAYGWVPPGVNNYASQSLDYGQWTQEKRNTEARKLYNEAGYSESEPFEIELLYNTSEGHKKIAVAIASMWKQTLGIKTRLLNQEWKVYLDARQQGKTQVYRAGWVGDYNDAFTFAEILGSSHGMNDMGYNNPEYDRLINSAARETDAAKREALLQQAERVMLNDHPVIPLYFYVNARLRKPWVKGFMPNIMDHHYSKNIDIAPH